MRESRKYDVSCKYTVRSAGANTRYGDQYLGTRRPFVFSTQQIRIFLQTDELSTQKKEHTLTLERLLGRSGSAGGAYPDWSAINNTCDPLKCNSIKQSAGMIISKTNKPLGNETRDCFFPAGPPIE
jgi:hypothetical protein